MIIIIPRDINGQALSKTMTSRITHGTMRVIQNVFTPTRVDNNRQQRTANRVDVDQFV